VVRRFATLLVAATRPIPGAAEALEALAGRTRLGIVSNYPYPPVVEDSLERAGLAEPFETVVVSGSLGWVKPDVRPFRRALRDLRVSATSALFVGDTLATDVLGARAAGMRTAWFRRDGVWPGEGTADHRIDRLEQVVELSGLRPAVTAGTTPASRG
jgi:putative hydrolase of the HAD superfamily